MEGEGEGSTRREEIEPTPLEREAGREAEEAAADAARRRSRRPHIALRSALLPHEMLAIIGGFGLLTLLIVDTLSDPFLVHPVAPLAALIFFLYPYRRIVIPRRLIQLGIMIFMAWLAVTLSGVLFPFIAAFILAYLFAPVVAHAERRYVPRWASSLGIVLAIVGVYVLIGVYVIPGLVGQFDELIRSAGALLNDTQALLERDRIVEWASGFGIPREEVERFVANSVEPQLRDAAAWIFGNVRVFVSSATSIVEGLLNLILIPFLTFYMLTDFHRVRRFVRSTLLQDNPRHVGWVRQVDLILSSYIRGILLTSSLVGSLAILILSIFDVPYAVVIGLLTGLFNLIPTLGMFINLGVAMIIYLFSEGSFVRNTLITAGMIFGLHALNGYFVEPRVIGERVGLHPVILIASLFVFGHFLGFVGLLIAVPTTAVMLMFLKEWYNNTVAGRRAVPTIPASTTSEEAPPTHHA